MRSRFFYPHISAPTIARHRVFAFTPGHPLWRGCRFFAGGSNPGGTRAEDSSPLRNHGTLTNMDPTSDTVFAPELRRTAYSFTASYSQSIVAANPVASTPISISAFFSVKNVTASHVICSVATTAQNSPYFALQVSGDVVGDPLRAVTGDGSATGIAISGTVTANVWHHGIAEFSSPSSRRAYLNSIGGASDTTSLTYSGALNQLAVGRLTRQTPILYADALITDIGIWSRILTTRELTVIANQSDAMLDGALYDPSRVSVAFASSTATAKYWLWAKQQQQQVIGGGLT